MKVHRDLIVTGHRARPPSQKPSFARRGRSVGKRADRFPRAARAAFPTGWWDVLTLPLEGEQATAALHPGHPPDSVTALLASQSV